MENQEIIRLIEAKKAYYLQGFKDLQKVGDIKEARKAQIQYCVLDSLLRDIEKLYL